MQRAERDLARARLTAAHDGPGAAFAAAITELREHPTPYHLAHGLLDHAACLLRTGDDQAVGAAIGEAGRHRQAAGLPAAARPHGHHPARPAPHRGLVMTAPRSRLGRLPRTGLLSQRSIMTIPAPAPGDWANRLTTVQNGGPARVIFDRRCHL